NSRLRRQDQAASGELAHYLIEVTPVPRISRHHRAHDRMLRLVKMTRGMLARRRVTASDVSATPTLAQCHPLRSLLETFFASTESARRREVLLSQSGQMFTWSSHRSSSTNSFSAQSVRELFNLGGATPLLSPPAGEKIEEGGRFSRRVLIVPAGAIRFS